MKKINIFSLILLTLTTTMSCNHTEHQEHSDHATAIELNEGKKWTVNAEMTPFIIDTERRLKNYDQIDYKSLAQYLKENNSNLIKSCTMKDKSHDELHKWLAPHLDLVKALGKAENTEEANKIVAELEKSLETYNTYFQ